MIRTHPANFRAAWANTGVHTACRIHVQAPQISSRPPDSKNAQRLGGTPGVLQWLNWCCEIYFDPVLPGLGPLLNQDIDEDRGPEHEQDGV